MLALSIRSPLRASPRRLVRGARWLSYEGKTADPLRILYCGSDEFSIDSLRVLHDHHIQDKQFIESIHVVAKEGKRAGRHLKTIRQVPIVQTTQELSLPLHQISTFTGWSPPNAGDAPFNLIIAVSFGLLIPSRILSQLKYGGLNLHPSLLPELRGPAPLHHTILQGKQTSGITLQTLHPTNFDGGQILAQDPFTIPDPNSCTFEHLRDAISPASAEFLVRHLRSLTFIDPAPLKPTYAESYARKLERDDAHADWKSWSTEQILRTQRALGHIWNMLEFPAKPGLKKRIKLHGLQYYEGILPSSDLVLEPGQMCAVEDHESDAWMPIIKTVDGDFLTPSSITVDGEARFVSPGRALTKDFHDGRSLE